jgi:hypothetical protein
VPAEPDGVVLCAFGFVEPGFEFELLEPELLEPGFAGVDPEFGVVEFGVFGFVEPELGVPFCAVLPLVATQGAPLGLLGEVGLVEGVVFCVPFGFWVPLGCVAPAGFVGCEFWGFVCCCDVFGAVAPVGGFTGGVEFWPTVPVGEGAVGLLEGAVLCASAQVPQASNINKVAIRIDIYPPPRSLIPLNFSASVSNELASHTIEWMP